MESVRTDLMDFGFASMRNDEMNALRQSVCLNVRKLTYAKISQYQQPYNHRKYSGWVTAVGGINK